MRRYTYIPFFLYLCMLTVPQAQAGQIFQQPGPSQAFATDHVLVKFKPQQIKRRFGRTTDIDRNSLSRTLGLPDGTEFRNSQFTELQRRKSKRAKLNPDTLDLNRYLYLTIPANTSITRVLKALRQNENVEYAEPDYIGTGGTTIPNDPDFNKQWYHYNTIYTNGSVPSDTRAVEAWDITTGSSNIIVAVLDTGLNTSLVEFVGRTVPGYDFAYNDADPNDDNNHGTGVASVMGATGDNTNQIAGVNWRCRIMPVKVLNSGNSGLYSWWADGIDWAVSNGAKVINLSSGGSTSDTTLSNAIMNAIARGVIFVTITHNDGSSNIRFPGRMEACITVGATYSNDTWASFSNYGSAIDLVAPGHNMALLLRTGVIQQGWYGTSFAAPQVAGAAGMLAGLNPDITHAEACALLTAGADDQVGDAKDVAGFDNYHGWGRLNIYNTLILAQTRINNPVMGTNDISLNWESPPNASNRTPYHVEATYAPPNNWTSISQALEFSYTTSQTVWEGSLPATSSAWFRTRIQSN